jgi:cell division septation protein DedD
MEDNPSLYLLSLTRGRLVAVGVVVFCLFALFFFFGLAVGIKSADGVNPASASVGSNALPEGVSELSFADASQSESTGRKEGAPERPLPFTKSTSGSRPTAFPKGSDSHSSKTLLALDNLEQPVRKPAFQRSADPSANLSRSSSGDHFYLQLVSTSDKAKAEKLVSSLNQKNFKSYWRQKNEAGSKPLYMVRVGPYESRSKATNDLAAFRDRGYKDSYMVILRSGKTDMPQAPLAPSSTAVR